MLVSFALTPISYRGYVYTSLDSKHCYYYLGSRFYSPLLSRFMNADSMADTGTGVVGTNMFAYCNNSPVIMQDYNGKSPALVIGATVIPMYYVVSMSLAVIFFVAIFSNGTIQLSLAEAMSNVIFYIKNMSKKGLSALKLAFSIASAKSAIEGIAESYGIFKCLEAAKAMEAELKKRKLPYSFVKLTITGDRGFVMSYSYSDTECISKNGQHFGILFEGKIYCNIHPFGLYENEWIADFYGLGYKTVYYYSSSKMNRDSMYSVREF